MLRRLDSMQLLQHRYCFAVPQFKDQQLPWASQLRMQKSGPRASSKCAGFRVQLRSTCPCGVQDTLSLVKREVSRGRTSPVVTKGAAKDAPSLSEERVSHSTVATLQQPSTDQVATDSFLATVQTVKLLLQTLGRDGSGLEISNVVSQLQRLGLSGHFQTEIRDLLENLHRRWKSISDGALAADAATDTDLGFTAMTFSLLRSHKYDVTPEPFTKFFKDGKLLSVGLPKEDGAATVAGVLDLKCATDFLFPGEEVFLEDVRRSTVEYLTAVLENNSQIPISLSTQIQHELSFHWYRKIPMVETLQYLKIYKDGAAWTGSSAIRNLAIENLKSWQPRLLEDIQVIDRWNRGCKVPELPFVRDVAELLSVMMMASIGEPHERPGRLAMAQLGSLGYVVDDLFDEHGSLDELRVFAESLQRWEPSLPESFPEPVKIIYNATWETIKDLGQQASVLQGRDVRPRFQKVFSALVDANLVEAERTAAKYEPTWDEYMENANISVGIYTSCFLSVLLQVQLSEEQVEHEDFIRAFQLMTYITRLMNDLDGYKRDKTINGKANVVGIFVRESGGRLGEAEAVAELMKMVDEARFEMVQLLLSSSAIPVDAKRFMLMTIRYALLSTDVSHPIVQCMNGRPEKLPDSTRSWSAPVLREFNKQLQEISCPA